MEGWMRRRREEVGKRSRTRKGWKEKPEREEEERMGEHVQV